jgi:hypothetical protein
MKTGAMPLHPMQPPSAPLFDACQRDALQRLLAVSLGLLHARIEGSARR